MYLRPKVWGRDVAPAGNGLHVAKLPVVSGASYIGGSVMRTETKNPPAVGADAAGLGVQAEQLMAASFTHKQTKIKRILAELARGGSLHRFQA